MTSTKLNNNLGYKQDQAKKSIPTVIKDVTQMVE